MLKKSFKYRLSPTRKQIRLLESTLTECRWFYNRLLEERKTAWEQSKQSLSYYDQAVSLPPLKVSRPSLKTVHSQVLQNVAVRIDLAFKAFYRRVKAREDPGFPRFRGKFRYDSFTFPQSGFEIINNKLNLSKIGHIKIKLHRPIDGSVKTCTIKRTATNKWFVYFTCEVKPNPLPVCNKSVGIDVGLTSFVTMSTGEKISNPRFFKQEEKALAKSQRKLSKQTKGTPERAKARKVVARVHERIKNKRHNFAHQQSRKIINKNGTICVEDLSINKMVHNHCLSKSIHDAAWSQFLHAIEYKAEYADRRFIKVNPAYTSQDCHKCGHRQKLKLSNRTYHCTCCGLEMCRDQNAAINIKTLGMQSLLQPTGRS